MSTGDKLHTLLSCYALEKTSEWAQFDVTLLRIISECVLTENEVFSHSTEEYRNENNKEKPCHGTSW